MCCQEGCEHVLQTAEEDETSEKRYALESLDPWRALSKNGSDRLLPGRTDRWSTGS